MEISNELQEKIIEKLNTDAEFKIAFDADPLKALNQIEGFDVDEIELSANDLETITGGSGWNDFIVKVQEIVDKYDFTKFKGL